LKRFRLRLINVGGLIFLLLAFGTAGFVAFGNYPLFDAFYMALTTITTIGYGEVHPLGTVGRIFNICYILIGVSTLLAALGMLTQSLLELESGNYFRKRRTKRMIDKLDKHYIVCGFGRVGRSASEELLKAHAPFVVVDSDESRVDRAMEEGMIAVCADCTQDETLREVGVERASGLIATLATDADNLFLILSAKALNTKLTVATRVSAEESEQKLRRAGAEIVFAPFSMTGHRLTQSLLRPHVNEFLTFTTGTMGLDVRIEQVRVSEKCEYVSKSLRQAQLRSDLGVIVLAIRRSNGQMLFNPPADSEMTAGDHLIAMGTPDKLRALEGLLAEIKV
jgi:voltage-gated potassium channel